MEEQLIGVGAAARSAGVGVQTVRYYERRGLVMPEARSDSGYRLYGEESLRRLRFIRNAQGLGFSLDEIRSLLSLRAGRRSQCAGVARRAAAKLRIVRSRIAALEEIQRALSSLVRACRARETTGACPILRSLEPGPAARRVAR